MRTEQELVTALCSEYQFIYEYDLPRVFDDMQDALVLERELRERFNYTREELDMVWDDAVENC